MPMPATGARNGGAANGDLTPFDRWLHGALVDRFEAVVREPVPEALMQILDRVASRG